MTRMQAPLTDDLPTPTRVSGLAVASLIFGLLCCIPGSGLLGVILGGAGLIRIGQAEGRLSGRGLAMIGIVLGMLSTVLYAGVVLGGLATMNRLTVYARVVESAQKGDAASVRAMLSPATAGALSDDAITEFGSRVTQEWGAYRG